MGIKTLLRGESKNVEYKLTPPSRSINYAKTAVAFANGQGGCLVFGVEDQTLRVVGIAEDKVFTVMDSISDAIVNSCEPLIIPDITMHDVASKTVIVAEIAPGLQRPYHIKSLGQEQGTFVRVAGTTRQADQPTIRELTIEGSNRSFDQVQCLGLSVTEEDIEALCASLTKTAKDNAEDPEKVKTVTEKQLLQWGVLAEQDGQLVPTNAYAILTGNTACSREPPKLCSWIDVSSPVLRRSLSKSPTSMCCATSIWALGSKACTGRTCMRFHRMPFES